MVAEEVVDVVGELPVGNVAVESDVVELLLEDAVDDGDFD